MRQKFLDGLEGDWLRKELVHPGSHCPVLVRLRRVGGHAADEGLPDLDEACCVVVVDDLADLDHTLRPVHLGHAVVH